GCLGFLRASELRHVSAVVRPPAGNVIVDRRVFTTGGREKTTLGCIALWLKIPPTRNSSVHSTPYFHRASRPECGTPVALGKSASPKNENDGVRPSTHLDSLARGCLLNKKRGGGVGCLQAC